MGISEVNKSKKINGNTIYVKMKDSITVAQIFSRVATISNEELKITNFIAPQFF